MKSPFFSFTAACLLAASFSAQADDAGARKNLPYQELLQKVAEYWAVAEDAQLVTRFTFAEEIGANGILALISDSQRVYRITLSKVASGGKEIGAEYFLCEPDRKALADAIQQEESLQYTALSSFYCEKYIPKGIWDKEMTGRKSYISMMQDRDGLLRVIQHGGAFTREVGGAPYRIKSNVWGDHSRPELRPFFPNG